LNNTKSNVNVRIDANVKKMANLILARMGIDQTTAIDMFFRQIIAEKRLPFQPSLIVDEKSPAGELSDNETPKPIDILEK